MNSTGWPLALASNLYSYFFEFSDDSKHRKFDELGIAGRIPDGSVHVSLKLPLFKKMEIL